MGITPISKQYRDGPNAVGDFIFMGHAGGDVDAGRRDDFVHGALEFDLAFEPGETGPVADEIVKLIGIVAMRHLIIRNGVRQISGFVNGDVNIRIRV